MEIFDIKFSERQNATKSILKNNRKKGYIPAVIYGGDMSNKNIWVGENEVKKVIARGRNQIVKLGDSEALIKEIQFDPVTDRIIHIDFMRVSKETLVSVEVALNIVGEAYGVKQQGGILEQHLSLLKVKCRSDSIPEKIDVDVTDLKIGEAIRVKDLKLPSGVRVIEEPERIVVNVIAFKVIEEKPAEVIQTPPAETQEPPKQ